MTKLNRIVNNSAGIAAARHESATYWMAYGYLAVAIRMQEMSADYAADAMFNRLLLIHDDVDAAEAAFDYVG